MDLSSGRRTAEDLRRRKDPARAFSIPNVDKNEQQPKAFQAAMLRYLAIGPRDFTKSPVPIIPRLNWEFYAVFDGFCAPTFPGGKTPQLRTKTLWVLPARTQYGWMGNGRPCQRAAFHFPSVPSELDWEMKGRNFLAASLEEGDIARLKALAEELKGHLASPHQFSNLVCSRALLDLSLIVLKDVTRRHNVPLMSAASDRVERAIAWYGVHMADNPKIEEVAASVHMTGTHLRRLFRKVKGEPPLSVFRKMQIERAMALMVNTSDTLQTISIQCGFQCATDFARVFRRVMDTSANTWRKNILAAG